MLPVLPPLTQSSKIYPPIVAFYFQTVRRLKFINDRQAPMETF